MALLGSGTACSSLTTRQTTGVDFRALSFDLRAEVLDVGEQVTSLALDTSEIPGIDPSSIDERTFRVHATSRSPIEGREVSGAFDGERAVTGIRLEEGRVLIDLESGAGVVGASTLGNAAIKPGFLGGDGRNLVMNLDYTITQNTRFIAGDRQVEITQFRQNRLLSPEVDAFEAAVSRDGMKYRLFSPEEVDGKAALVMWLHGNGSGGLSVDEYNNESQLRSHRGGVAFATPEAQEALGGAYVVAPQSPDSWFYDPERGYHDRLNTLLDEVFAAHPDIDPKRVYVVGGSAGGLMAARFAGEHADKVAAVVPIAPAFWVTSNKAYMVTAEQILKIKDIPSWFIHSRNDVIIDYEKSSAWAYNLLRPSGNVELTSYDRVVWDGREYFGHSSWIPASHNAPVRSDGSHLWEWLGKQSK